MLDAVAWVAKYCWIFLPHYKFDYVSGVWSNRDEKEQSIYTWISNIDYSQGSIGFKKRDVQMERLAKDQKHDYKKPFEEAEDLLAKVIEGYKTLYGKSTLDMASLIPEKYHKLIWWLFPTDVLPILFEIKASDPNGKLTF